MEKKDRAQDKVFDTRGGRDGLAVHNANASQGVGDHPNNGKEDLIRPFRYSKQDGRNYPKMNVVSGTVISSRTGSSESGRWGRSRGRFSTPPETSGRGVAQASRAQLQPSNASVSETS